MSSQFVSASGSWHYFLHHLHTHSSLNQLSTQDQVATKILHSNFKYIIKSKSRKGNEKGMKYMEEWKETEQFDNFKPFDNLKNTPEKNCWV